MYVLKGKGVRERLEMSRKKTKSRTMSDETFRELMESAQQALAYERGEVLGHRVTRIAVPRPPRPQLNYSQSVCAVAERQPQNGPSLGASDQSAE